MGRLRGLEGIRKISLPSTGRARRGRRIGSEVRRVCGDGQVEGEHLAGLVLRCGAAQRGVSADGGHPARGSWGELADDGGQTRLLHEP